uniref:Protein RRNAD1-like n=1 Tax=Phallusia mammillata TaxID=59560 RepID=A0A6F9DRI7_9ASCI|nr:protein RRNAD1-like [Phallusia mammillata]
MLLKLSCQEKMLKHIFRKHVKPKKQHEIYLLSKTVAELLESSKCSDIIDFGSGQGHLARSLTLGYNCPVITLEQNKNFIKKAEEFDDDACKTLHKANRQADVVGQVTARHVQYNVSTDVAADIFIDTIDKKVQSHVEPTYLLTGLHACGDLSATMIRLYKESPRIAALVSVACCYMKLSTEPESTYIGYPMSLYVKGLDNHKIPYKSRESACHALEDYRCRLKGAGPQLRMHCYRAALGTILRKLHPDMVRLPVQTIKKAFNLSFVEYVALAFKKLKLSAPNEVDVQEAESLLSQWVHVVIYFCLCLMVAPTVESIILLDRMIYLKEHGLNCEIKSLFEPKLSPRCFAIIASKDSQ